MLDECFDFIVCIWERIISIWSDQWGELRGFLSNRLENELRIISLVNL